MFLISLELVAVLSRSTLQGNYTSRGRAVCMRFRGRKCVLDILRTAPSRLICTGFGVTLTFTVGSIQGKWVPVTWRLSSLTWPVEDHVSASTQNRVTVLPTSIVDPLRVH